MQMRYRCIDYSSSTQRTLPQVHFLAISQCSIVGAETEIRPLPLTAMQLQCTIEATLYLFCVCVASVPSHYPCRPCVSTPRRRDQLTAKAADMEKALLSCDITTKVLVKWGLDSTHSDAWLNSNYENAMSTFYVALKQRVAFKSITF